VLTSEMVCHIVDLTCQALCQMPLDRQYRSEEDELMPAVKRHLEETFTANGIKRIEVIPCKGEGSEGRAPHVYLLGTSFWPDLELQFRGKPILVIELKLVKPGPRTGLSKSISEALGQMLIYTLKYPHVIGFVAQSVAGDAKRHEYDNEFPELCRRHEVKLLIRRFGPAA
jgi:hypothetical protein